MMGRFDNKVVLVTGGAGGLGRATVLAFAAEGASIVFSYHNSATEAVDEVCAQAQSLGAAIEPCRADISQSADVTALVGAAMARFGRIDILVNSAGLSRDDAFLSLTEEAFDEVIAVNLKGPFLVSQAVGRHMVAQEYGRIINISATTAIVARAGNANYTAAKAGLNMLTQSMAIELGPHVTVNAVGLGFVDSPLVRTLFSEEALQEAESSVPVKRMTSYEETASFILLLASDECSFMTGKTIPFDGGRVMR